jgi:two-component system CheB/CheR fusion protein
LAQQPESAQFDSMPNSAITAGCIDIVALPAEMPARILGATGLSSPASPSMAGSDEHSPAALGAILTLLQRHTRHDLALYKCNSVVRRIGRRMAVHGLDTMDAYAAFLRENAHELDLLFKEMLIGVTSFFRDPDAWNELMDTVLPAVLSRRGADSPGLRAWVVGCSTGEEAYSLAMAFTEVVEALPEYRAQDLQVFATDLNADAIAVARGGHYPATRSPRCSSTTT